MASLAKKDNFEEIVLIFNINHSRTSSSSFPIFLPYDYIEIKNRSICELFDHGKKLAFSGNKCPVAEAPITNTGYWQCIQSKIGCWLVFLSGLGQYHRIVGKKTKHWSINDFLDDNVLTLNYI